MSNVIIYGASDDLIEFDGAIYGEAGVYTQRSPGSRRHPYRTRWRDAHAGGWVLHRQPRRLVHHSQDTRRPVALVAHAIRSGARSQRGRRDSLMIRALTLTALAATGAIGTFLLLLAGREAAVTD